MSQKPVAGPQGSLQASQPLCESALGDLITVRSPNSHWPTPVSRRLNIRPDLNAKLRLVICIFHYGRSRSVVDSELHVPCGRSRLACPWPRVSHVRAAAVRMYLTISTKTDPISLEYICSYLVRRPSIDSAPSSRGGLARP